CLKSCPRSNPASWGREPSGYLRLVKALRQQIATLIHRIRDIWRRRRFGGSLRRARALPNDFAFFHYEVDALGCSDVGGRIARHRNDIGQFPFFFIIVSVSGFITEPRSIESTPASIASRAA